MTEHILRVGWAVRAAAALALALEPELELDPSPTVEASSGGCGAAEEPMPSGCEGSDDSS